MLYIPCLPMIYANVEIIFAVSRLLLLLQLHFSLRNGCAKNWFTLCPERNSVDEVLESLLHAPSLGVLSLTVRYTAVIDNSCC